MKHVVLMCLLIYIHTSTSKIFNQRVSVGKDAMLVCYHERNVIWSKGRDGTKVDILTAEEDGETQKINSDPHNRYSVLGDLSLYIKSVLLSDSGIYYCNATPTVNLIITEPGSATSNDRHTETTTPKPETTTSNYSQPGATTPTPETTTTSNSQPGATTSTTVNSTNTTQPNSTQSNSSNSELNSTKETTTSNYSQPGAKTPTTEGTTFSQPGATIPTTTAKPKTTVDSVIKSVTNSTATKEKPTYIIAAVSGGVVFLVLILLLWACIKRKTALSNKKDNVYETVDDSYSTVQPAPPQKTNDAIYYLAGDPDVVKLGKDGQRHEFDDPTYTLIGLSESKSKENLNEQGPDVPLYSTIK